MLYVIFGRGFMESGDEKKIGDQEKLKCELVVKEE